MPCRRAQPSSTASGTTPCGRSRLVCEIIAHLNDDHRWTREEIGAWVGEIEPADAQPPEDVPEAAWREDESVAIIHDQWARCSGGM